MKYVVTGGAGFIGSHIVEELISQGHEVSIFDNLFSGKEKNIEPFLKKQGVNFVNGSVTDLSLLKDTFKGADGVFHEAAIASVPRSVANPSASNEVNVTGTLNVLIAARDTDVKKVLFASSSSIYGDTPTLPKTEEMNPSPLSPYAVSKLAGEYYMGVFSSVYGIKTLALRYFNVFGPRQDPKSEYAAVIPKFITSILNHQSPTIYGDGKQTRDFTYVKDVALANIRGMDSNAEGVCNIAYCQRIDLIELADIIMEITGIKVPVKFEAHRVGDVRDSLADINRAKEKFGYSPEFTVRSGLEETVKWYKN
jgi:UDP-glucose 4-epimerase